MAELTLSNTQLTPLRTGRRWRRRPGRNTMLWLGLLILVPVVLAAVLAPVLPIPAPTTPAPLDALQAPSLAHPFGTDRIGRDVFSRTLAGARISLLVALTSATLAITTGIVVGTLSGFLGRRLDAVLMAANNVLLAFPSLLLAIALVAVFGAGIWQVVLAITVADAPRAVRMQRSMVLSLSSRGYIDAARLAAAPWWWILARHIVPNTVVAMAVVGSIYAASAIVVESSLSFLGLGIVPPTPSWGNIIAEGRPFLREGWWITTFPGIAIVLVSIALHLLADGLRDRLSTAP
ncbi:MAG TPA: ABC transporter permease [Kribbella sp.]|jgi:peptide/nickel transport system permease protein